MAKTPKKQKPPTPDSKNEIVLKRLRELVPDPRNSVQHGEDNLDSIRQSLRLYAQAEPLTLQRGTNRLVGGHGRVIVMIEEGWEWAECIERDLTDAEATDLNVRLNAAPKTSTWNVESLEAIQREGAADLTAIFGTEELSQILTGVISGLPNDEEASAALLDVQKKATDFIAGYAEGEQKGKNQAFRNDLSQAFGQAGGLFHERGLGEREKADRIEREPGNEVRGGKRFACPSCGFQWNGTPTGET